MIRVDAVWLSMRPLDMRAGTDTVLARIVQVFGEARPHHAYLFANARANRMKVLVHDGIGIWLAARRLHQGRFFWPVGEATATLSRGQFDALVLGLPHCYHHATRLQDPPRPPSRKSCHPRSATPQLTPSEPLPCSTRVPNPTSIRLTRKFCKRFRLPEFFAVLPLLAARFRSLHDGVHYR